MQGRGSGEEEGSGAGVSGAGGPRKGGVLGRVPGQKNTKLA